MSSNIYTLKFDIDDNKIRDLEKRIMGMMGGGTSGSSGIAGKMMGASGGGGGMGVAKNIAKLIPIAGAVIGILLLLKKLTNMIVESSPMLQQMLKLVNFGIMLILRPIGDFFGFFLKPIVIYFLRSVILPWYKAMRTDMAKKGVQAGKNFMNDPLGFSLRVGGLGMLGQIIGNLDKIGLAAEGVRLTVNLRIKKFIDNFILPSIGDVTQKIKDWVKDFKLWGIGRVVVKIKKWVRSFEMPTLEGIILLFNTWVSEMKLPSWDDFNTTIETIKTTVMEIIDSILGIFQGILDKLLGRKSEEEKTNTTTVQPVVVWGDANRDGKFDMGDLMFSISDFVKGS